MIYIPKEKEDYFSINLYGEVEQHLYCSEHKVDFHLIKSGNCYRTEEDGVRARNRSYALRELEVLADELNGNSLINWEDNQQCKFAIIYVYFTKEFDCVEIDNVKSSGDEPICLDSNFLVYALQRLGIDKLKIICDIKE